MDTLYARQCISLMHVRVALHYYYQLLYCVHVVLSSALRSPFPVTDCRLADGVERASQRRPDRCCVQANLVSCCLSIHLGASCAACFAHEQCCCTACMCTGGGSTERQVTTLPPLDLHQNDGSCLPPARVKHGGGVTAVQTNPGAEATVLHPRIETVLVTGRVRVGSISVCARAIIVRRRWWQLASAAAAAATGAVLPLPLVDARVSSHPLSSRRSRPQHGFCHKMAVPAASKDRSW